MRPATKPLGTAVLINLGAHRPLLTLRPTLRVESADVLAPVKTNRTVCHSPSFHFSPSPILGHSKPPTDMRAPHTGTLRAGSACGSAAIMRPTQRPLNYITSRSILGAYLTRGIGLRLLLFEPF